MPESLILEALVWRRALAVLRALGAGITCMPATLLKLTLLLKPTLIQDHSLLLLQSLHCILMTVHD